MGLKLEAMGKREGIPGLLTQKKKRGMGLVFE